jgi:hypothetical protein
MVPISGRKRFIEKCLARARHWQAAGANSNVAVAAWQIEGKLV